MAKASVKKVLQYWHDGKPISKAQNKISSIAWWYTAGLPGTVNDEKGHEHLPAADFRVLLAKLGVEDPKQPFEVKLPNDIVLKATLETALVAVPRATTAAAKKSPAKKTAAKKAAPAKAAAKKAPAEKKLTNRQRAALSNKARAENEVHKAWEKAGKVGPEPDTTNLKALNELASRQPSKGSQIAAKTTQALKKPAAKRAAAKTVAKNGTMPARTRVRKATVPATKAAAKRGAA